MAHLVAYIIMILFTLTSIGGTSFLWYTYFDIKYNLDHTRQSMWLWESARNEDAFFWYSIVATVITVSIQMVVIQLFNYFFLFPYVSFHEIKINVIEFVLQVIILLIVLVMRKQVGFLAELFQETAKCLGNIPALFFQPLVTFVVLLIFFVFWIFVVVSFIRSCSNTHF